MSEMSFEQIAQLGETMEIRAGNISTKTTLQDILDANRFVMLQPTYKLAPVMIDYEEPVRFFLFRPNGVFSLDAVLEERYKQDEIALCRFRAVSGVKRIQRRYSYRLAVVLDVVIRPMTLDMNMKEPGIPGKTLNISEKGVCFVCHERFARGRKLSLQLDLISDGVMTLNAEVLRCELPMQKNDPYIIGAQFIDPPEWEQVYLRKFIIKRQVFQRKYCKD